MTIRQDGYLPFVSDWVTLTGKRTVIPPIRLRPFQMLTGQIEDRHGRAIAGVRVFLPGGTRATATDAAGRFVLAGIDPGKTVVLAEQAGFRIKGWVVDLSKDVKPGGAGALSALAKPPGPS